MSLLTAFSTDPELQIRDINVGRVSDSIVEVTFATNVVAVSYTAGITIEVDGAGAEITSAARQTDHRKVQFTMTAPITQAQTVDVVYDASSGNYNAEDSLIDFDKSGHNWVGAGLWFDTVTDSGHIITVGL
jgi:hypothetical protein